MTRLGMMLALLATVSAACGADEVSGNGDGSCEPPNGTWLLTFKERINQCDVGTFESVGVFDGTRASLESLPDGCTGSRRLSGDGCDLAIDQTCTVKSPSGTVLATIKDVGTLHFVNDDKATGQFLITSDGGGDDVCSSTFDLTAKPQ